MLVPVKNGDVVEISSNDNDTFTTSNLATAKQNIYFVPITRVVKPNENCVSYVVETGHNLDNTAFYRKYSDGYIEQWGSATANTNGEITLPTPFATTTQYTVTGSCKGGTTPGSFFYVLSKQTSKFGYYSTTDADWSGGYNQGFGFDASRSNAIYGRSNTVTPPSVKLLPCMKL